MQVQYSTITDSILSEKMQAVLLLVLVCSALGKLDLEDAELDFKGLAVKYGQKVNEYDIITEDGYILKLFNLVGDKKRPVLFGHGLMDSSDGSIIRGNRSLAVRLARNGYDVWAINHRGNRYSRHHTTLDPDKDPSFWNFYAHEFGSKDLPATIDFIIEKTGSKVSLIGYSQGTTNALILGAERPEYNEKINVFIAMAPICYLHNTRDFLPTLLKLGPDINKGLRRSRTEEVLAYRSPLKAAINFICRMQQTGYALCMQGAVFLFTGADTKNFEPDFLPIWLGHFPTGTSRKNLYHLVQIANRRRFARYDYGAKKNVLKYGSRSPPEYDLSKVTMKVAILVAKNDPVATVADTELLRRRLPNVVEYRVIDDEPFNHLDIIWGTNTYTVVLPHVLEILRKYT